jgi:SCY1-like protein 1
MGNSSSALPYSIDNQIGSDEFGWNIHNGTNKNDKSPVTVFVGKKPMLAKTCADKTGRNRGMMQLKPALHHFQNCKKVRHPHILQVLATLDTDHPDADATASATNAPLDTKIITGDLIIVTEPCVSLQTWLQTNRPTEEQLAWGLQSMIQALHFLHSSANLSHGLVTPSSFYVNRAGDVKLWNFSLVTPIGENLGPTNHFKEWDAILCPATFRGPERAESRWEAIQTTGIHAMDSYSMGVLIGTYYQAAGHPSIPTPLQKAVQRMQTANIRMRPRLQPLLKCPIFSSPYQALQQKLDEISIQPVEQKISFWQSLGQQMSSTGPNSGVVDQNMAVYKILPLIQTTIKTICTNEGMLSQDLYRREGKCCSIFVHVSIFPIFFGIVCS